MLRVYLAFFGIFLVSVLIIPNAFAENVPDWLVNNAGWWAARIIINLDLILSII
tara:strand:- start:376 stop:537 length:162 start_codon:yes stop_codon:yes gene_type:complete